MTDKPIDWDKPLQVQQFECPDGPWIDVIVVYTSPSGKRLLVGNFGDEWCLWSSSLYYRIRNAPAKHVSYVHLYNDGSFNFTGHNGECDIPRQHELPTFVECRRIEWEGKNE